MALDQTELAQIVSAVIQALKVGDTGAKPAPAAKPGNSLEARDRSIVAGLKRKGIPVDQIVLMDRADKAKPFNVKPFKQWLAEGWQVRRGEKSVRGLFHQSQCDRIAPKAPAKPAAKTKAKGKPAPATLPLV